VSQAPRNRLTPEQVGRSVLAVLARQADEKRRQGERTAAAVRALLKGDPALSAREVHARLPIVVSVRRVQQILKALRRSTVGVSLQSDAH
jgi:hypothetical protein